MLAPSRRQDQQVAASLDPEAFIPYVSSYKLLLTFIVVCSDAYYIYRSTQLQTLVSSRRRHDQQVAASVEPAAFTPYVSSYTLLWTLIISLQ